jgi:ATP-dependent DNA helicase RecG
MPSLTDPVRYLKGVGPEMARRLARLDIHTVRDLLFHAPTGYRDRSTPTPVASLKAGAEASVLATLARLEPVRRFRGRRDLAGTLRDETGFVRVVWFNQPYLQSELRVGERYLFAGAVQAFRGLEMHNPEFEPADGGGIHLHVGRITPRYALTQGVSERWIRARVRAALDELPDLPDLVPEESRAALGLPPLRAALEEVHFPPRLEAAEPARKRIALEEILTLQIALQYARRRHRRGVSALSLAGGAPTADGFVRALPFALTAGQQNALRAVGEDLDREVPMRRLLLGDVGSGKTVVALAAAARAAGAGHQAAVLAPTGILAEQHAATAARLLGPAGIPQALLTAATGRGEREEVLAGLASGEIPVVIGTHALLEQDLHFRSLALVVVDEQHRFGVRQRVGLTRRGANARAAHLLVLTATPIPRSLAMTLYGDLDVSRIAEKPPGRAPVETRAVDGTRPAALIELLREEMDAGGSAFVVYPVVEEGETMDLKDATSMAARLAAAPGLAEAGVTLAHGRLKAEERREALARFRDGRARILVATTVVEVGLDIPEATLVAIEHPERFGLAQLHQLRGRVGRADRPGRCVLVMGKGMGAAAHHRLGIFRTTNDGFRLAEEDLKLRGPGEFLGTSQHGFPRFRAARPLEDADLIEAGRDLGARLLERAEAAQGGRLKGWIEAHFAGSDRFLGSG